MKLVLAQPSEQGLEGLWQRLLCCSLWHPGKACSGKARWDWCHTTGLSCFPLPFPQPQPKTSNAYNASKLRVVHTSKSSALSASGGQKQELKQERSTNYIFTGTGVKCSDGNCTGTDNLFIFQTPGSFIEGSGAKVFLVGGAPRRSVQSL
jgi:hypothetical protein